MLGKEEWRVRKQVFILTSLLFMLTIGCAYQGPMDSLPPVPSDSAANIVVITGSAWTQNMAFVPVIDGIETYALVANQHISFQVAPGPHKVIGKLAGGISQITNESVINIEPKVSETVYLYFVLRILPVRATVTQISEAQALEYMKDATQVGVE